MKKAGLFNIFSLIFNLAILGGVIYPIVVLLKGEILPNVHFFHVVGALFLAATALICIPFNIIGIAKGRRLPLGIYTLKLVGTATALTATALTAGILGYANGWDLASVFGGFSFSSPEMFLLLVVPAVALLGFIFFDHAEKGKFVVNLFSLIPTGFYSGLYILNANMQFYPDPNGSYEWYSVSAINQIAVPIVFGGAILVAFLLSIIIYLLNRLLSKAFFKAATQEKAEPVQSREEAASAPVEEEEVEEPQEEKKVVVEDPYEEPVDEEVEEETAPEEEKEQPEEELEEERAVEEEPVEEAEEFEAEESVEEVEEEEAEEEEPQEEEVEEPVQEDKPAKKTTKKPAAPKKAAPKKDAPKEAPKDTGGTKVYHLTKRKEDSMWAITFVGGKKPVKLFKTKKEAEEYLAVLTKNQGATALIRNSKGAKAGKFASSIKSDEDKK